VGGKDLKRIEKLLRLPPEYDFNDLEKVLNFFGFYKENSKGSHNIFVLKQKQQDMIYEAEQITIPTVKGRKVRKPYLKLIIKILHLEEWYEKNKK